MPKFLWLTSMLRTEMSYQYCTLHLSMNVDVIKKSSFPLVLWWLKACKHCARNAQSWPDLRNTKHGSNGGVQIQKDVKTTYNDNVKIRHEVIRKHAHQNLIFTHSFEPVTFLLQTSIVLRLTLLLRQVQLGRLRTVVVTLAKTSKSNNTAVACWMTECHRLTPDVYRFNRQTHYHWNNNTRIAFRLNNLIHQPHRQCISLPYTYLTLGEATFIRMLWGH